MVAVVPSTPKAQAPQGARSPKPAGGADFGAFLERADDERRPAPEAVGKEHPPALEASPEDPAPGPELARENRAPAAKTEAAPTAKAEAPAPVAAPEEADQDQEEPAQRAKDQQSLPLPAAPQTFIPLVPLDTAQPLDTAAAVTESLPAESAPTPAPAAKPLKGLTPAGTQRTPRQTEDQEPDLLPLEGLAEAEQLDTDSLLPKIAPSVGGQHPSADLLSFDELARPDLQVEVSPEPVLDQLQQAVNTALLDESAQIVMPQVVRGLATLVSEGVSEMRLQLMPEDLGEIEVRVRTSEGVVRAEMMVQNPEVKQLLDQHLDRLRSALHQQGLDLRGFDIGLSPDGRFAQPDRSGQGSQPQRGPRGREALGAAPETTPPVLAPRGALTVDYLA